MNDKKIGFFSRMKIAIFKFDEYEKFITEEPKFSIKYLLKLILIFSLIVTIALCYVLATNTKIFLEKFNQEVPDFSVSNGSLDIKDNEEFEMYFDYFDVQLIMNENSKEYIETDYINNIELLENRAIIRYNGFMQEVSYKDLTLSKQMILEEYNKNKTQILIIMFIVIFAFSFIPYFIIFLIDIVMLAILGYIINKIIKTQFKFKDIFKISIFAMTLPIILYLLYILANILMGVTTKYFSIAYNTISYIYIVTVLMIMKSDIIKNSQELQSILEEEKKVKEELARQKQEEKEKQEEANRERKKKKEKEEPKTEPQTEN